MGIFQKVKEFLDDVTGPCYDCEEPDGNAPHGSNTSEELDNVPEPLEDID